jgi:hypothetical protein
MKQALVIGNGVSRLKFNLNKLNKHYITYGCNALYRDFIPDYLISMDIHMVSEILNAMVHYKCQFYTQHMNDIDLLAGNGKPIHFIKSLPSTPDSGTAAVELASSHEHTHIYLIGFDYNNGLHNNVYAGTHNYNNKDYSTPIQQDQRWRSRLHSIIKQHKNIQYYRVTDEVYVGDLENYNHIAINQFEEQDVRI